MPKVPKITHFFSKIFAISQTAVRDKVDFVVDVNFDSIRLTLSYLMGVSGYAKCTQNNKYAIFLQYLKKEVVMKYTFSMLINTKVFCKLILSFLMGLARHTQSTQTSL